MDPLVLKDPLMLGRLLWPDVTLYREQRSIVESVWANDTTLCYAGNKLGKDFIAGYLILLFFLTRHPCRIVTTSVDHGQLENVLWGEIRRFIQTSRIPLEVERGGPLVVNHMHLKKHYDGRVDGLSYCIGRVAARGEGMLGHHVAYDGKTPKTLFVADEASGVDDMSWERADTWANRKLAIGNPYPCRNFFYNETKAGDLYEGNRCYRKVLRIRAEDSPNVRFALAQQQAGQIPTGEDLLPGVLSWDDYRKRRTTWSSMRQCIGLDAKFWEESGTLMFPPQVLNRAEQVELVSRCMSYPAEAIGVDTAEGGDGTAMSAINRYGLKAQRCKKTRDTNVIPGEVIAFMHEHKVPAEKVVFDRGGGGKQHADRLRAKGYPVRTVGFGERVSLDLRRGLYQLEVRKELKEERYQYVNMRAQLYGELMEKFADGVFALPPEFHETRRQLEPIPLKFDSEGRLMLLPKHRRGEDGFELERSGDQDTLVGLIGCSPDEADSLVLALHGLLHRAKRPVAGAV